MATSKVRAATAASPPELCPHLPRISTLPSGDSYEVRLVKADELSSGLRDAIFELFDGNMSHLSAGSSISYTPQSKREELFHPDARYLLLTHPSAPPMPGSLPPPKAKGKGKGRAREVKLAPDEELWGYVGFRFDTEETLTSRDAEVVYCYELQLARIARGIGLARVLMDELEGIGRRKGMDKVMLTCLTANTGALGFYAKQGYRPDEIDPTRMDEEEGDEGDNDEGEEEEEGEEEAVGDTGSVDYRILSKSLMPPRPSR